MLQKVLEIHRLPRNVVDHEVEHQRILPADALDIAEIAEFFVHDVVPDRGKAAVGRGGEEGENVHPADRPFQRTIEKLVQLGEILPQAIGVGDEHNLVFHSMTIPFLWMKRTRPGSREMFCATREQRWFGSSVGPTMWNSDRRRENLPFRCQYTTECLICQSVDI